jgi:ribose 5-phosphate isomerase A
MSEAQKKAAALAAMALVKDGMTLGLGTGSTAAYFVYAVADAVRSGLKLTLTSTSQATSDLATGLGLNLIDINEIGQIDLVVDGADEVGPGLALIKGGGAALLREKLVWEQAKVCIVIADAKKSVQTLGLFPLPVEIEPFAHKATLNKIGDILAEFEISAAPVIRKKDSETVFTDGGHLICDIGCGVIKDVYGLALALKATTGVIDHGLFLELADVALIGFDEGVKTLHP